MKLNSENPNKLVFFCKLQAMSKCVAPSVIKCEKAFSYPRLKDDPPGISLAINTATFSTRYHCIMDPVQYP